MQIVCPNCATSYEVEAASLGESGRTVRCAHCKDLWFAEAPQLAMAEADDAPPSMWEADAHAHAQESGWGLPDPSIVPEDRFAMQQQDVDFAPPEYKPPPPPREEGDDEWDDSDGDEQSQEQQAESEADATAVLADGAEPDFNEIRRRRQARQGAKPKQKKLFSTPRLIAACCAVIAGLVLGREQVSRAMPQLVSLYANLGLPVNLRGLSFEGVRGVVEQQDGVSVLVIEGIIRNITRDQIDVPRLRFAMRNGAGAEIYSWTALPERSVLPGGDVQVFRTRLASPPGDSRQAYIRFFQKRDIVVNNQR
jgi:predicted Zn finger-like uncharacterized protein